MWLEKLEVAADDQQQIVEIVSNATGQLTHRLHLLRLSEPTLALA